MCRSYVIVALWRCWVPHETSLRDLNRSEIKLLKPRRSTRRGQILGLVEKNGRNRKLQEEVLLNQQIVRIRCFAFFCYARTVVLKSFLGKLVKSYLGSLKTLLDGVCVGEMPKTSCGGFLLGRMPKHEGWIPPRRTAALLITI